MTGIAWTDPSIDEIVRLLGARCGLSFRPNDFERVERGIRAACRRSQCKDLRAYELLLKSDSEIWDDLIVELTVGETYFFREPLQFEFIRKEILPKLVSSRDASVPIRMWSAGCASGEEAYSLAILLDQAHLLQRADILATDISTAALSKAREAIYGDWSLRGTGAALAKPYLQRKAEYHVLDEHIRRNVKFEMLNLAVDSYPSIVTGTRSLDLILCRNVLIYFDRAIVQVIVDRLYQSLAHGGWLLTASSDPNLDNYAPFETIVCDSGVFYRKADLNEPPLERTTGSGTARVSGVRRPDLDSTQRALSPYVGQSESTRNQAISGSTVTPAGPSTPPIRTVASTSTNQASRSRNGTSLEDVRQILAEGRYGRVVELTADRALDHDACVIRIQALANIDIARAERACDLAVVQHPLSTHLRYLHAVLLSENNRGVEAAEAARRVIYLDRKLAIAHLLLGSSLRQSGDLNGAIRAFRNAYQLCNSRPPNEIVPFSDGETAAQIARAAEMQMKHIAAASGVTL